EGSRGCVSARREKAIAVVVILERQGKLLEIVGARHSVGGFTHLLYGREQEADQHGDDRDHHQKLDQREPQPLPPSTGVTHSNLLSQRGMQGGTFDRRRATTSHSVAADIPSHWINGARHCQAILK